MDPLTLGIIMLIGGAVGGIVKGFSTKNSYMNAAEDLGTQIGNLEQSYQDSLDTVNDEYNFAKQEALDSAEQSDKAGDRSENLTSLMFNSAADQLQLKMESEGWQNQQSAISIGSQTSQSEAALASSGVAASSSASQAVQQNNAIMKSQLSQTIKQQEGEDSAALTQAYSGLVNNMASIGQARYNAEYARDSYKAGGKNYELYQDQLKSMSDSYNQKLNSYYDQAEQLESDLPWDMIGSFFGGASQGISVASGIVNFASSWNSAKLTGIKTSTANTLSFDSDAFGLKDSFSSFYGSGSGLSYNPFNISSF